MRLRHPIAFCARSGGGFAPTRLTGFFGSICKYERSVTCDFSEKDTKCDLASILQGRIYLLRKVEEGNVLINWWKNRRQVCPVFKLGSKWPQKFCLVFRGLIFVFLNCLRRAMWAFDAPNFINIAIHAFGMKKLVWSGQPFLCKNVCGCVRRGALFVFPLDSHCNVYLTCDPCTKCARRAALLICDLAPPALNSHSILHLKFYILH